jgi:hypothetical protein
MKTNLILLDGVLFLSRLEGFEKINITVRWTVMATSSKTGCINTLTNPSFSAKESGGEGDG